MSNFLHKGKRKKMVEDNKEVQKRFKEIVKIKEELNEVSAKMIEEFGAINIDDIEDVAQKFTDRTIGKYEKLLIASNLYRANMIKIDEDEVK